MASTVEGAEANIEAEEAARVGSITYSVCIHQKFKYLILHVSFLQYSFPKTC